MISSPLSRSLALLALAVAPAHAVVTLSDSFTDGDLVAGADASGIKWYDRSSNSTVSAGLDPSGFNSGNALILALANSTTFNRGVVGVLSQSFTLANPGDYISLSFSFRLSSTSGSVAPPNVANAFTFGLYNSNGTVVAADNAATSDNDFGFRAAVGTGTAPSVTLFKETNLAADPGGLGTGTDGASITVANSVPVAITTFEPHTATITLTYNSATDLGIALTYDGSPIGNGTSSVPFLTFDEIVFSQTSGTNFRLDDVVVTSNIPEPSSALLVACLGVLGCVGYRRR